MNGIKNTCFQVLTVSKLGLAALLFLSNLWTVQGLRADPTASTSTAARLREAVVKVPRASGRARALEQFENLAGIYVNKPDFAKDDYEAVTSGTARIESANGVLARGFRGEIQEPKEVPISHPEGGSSTTNPTTPATRTDYTPTIASLKSIVEASKEVRVGLMPEITREINEEKDRERQRALEEQALAFQRSLNPLGPSNSGPSSGSDSGGKGGGGGSGKSESGKFDLPNLSLGNPLESLRTDEANLIAGPNPRSDEVGSLTQPKIEKPAPFPKIALAQPTPAVESSASPILRNLQVLSGNRGVPGSAPSPFGGFGPSSSGGSAAEASPPLRASAPSNTGLGNSGLGDPSISPVADTSEPRYNFGAKSPDLAATGEDGEAVVQSSSGSGSASTETFSSKQVLPVGPPDEKGRSWIFSYSPGKMIQNSCSAVSQSVIREFCAGVKRRLAVLNLSK